MVRGAGTDYERLRQLAEAALAERESWYDAMGDDEASAPSEAMEDAWDLARGVLALLGELVAVQEERDAAGEAMHAQADLRHKAEAALVAVREERDADAKAYDTLMGEA